MAYGIRVNNGSNVTVIDEVTSAASYYATNSSITKESDFSGFYHPSPVINQDSLVAIYMDPNIESIYMSNTGETDGFRFSHCGSYLIYSYDGIPPSYPCKRITPMSNLGASTDAYGIRIFDQSGEITFDSGRNLATPTVSRPVYQNQQFNLPANCYVVFLNMKLYRDNNWFSQTGIRRISGNTWAGAHNSFGNIYPANNDLIGYIMAFEF